MPDAYKLHPPLKIQIQIESIAAFDNNVILGTRQGHLLQYSINSNPENEKIDLQLLQYNKSFSKKPIVQLEVIPEYKILFSLTDNTINVNDYSRHNFPIVHVAQKTKGATAFAMDVQKSTSLTGELSLLVRMCAAIKRKLQLWYWKHDQLLEYGKDIELSDVPKVICWSGNTICIGLRTEYVCYDLSKSTPTKRDLFPISSSRTMDPCISILHDDVFGIAKDEFMISIYANNQGDQELPTEGQYDPKAAEAGMSDSSDKRFGTLQWTEPLQQLVWDEPYLTGLVTDALEIRVFNAPGDVADNLVQKIDGLNHVRFLVKGTRGILYAASASQLWCIEMRDIQIQREQLLQEKKFQLALQLTSISNESPDDKQEKINEIQTLYAFDLFTKKEFKRSMKEFFLLGTDPIEVINLFPELLSSDGAKKGESMVDKLEDKELEQGYLALIDYLTEWRQKMRKESANNSGKMTQKGAKTLLSIIDTTLLKCYLQTNDSLVASVLRLNNCNLEESEKVLKKHRKYGELIILYQTKKQHKSALQLLQVQAEVQGSVLYGHERTIQYLQHLDSKNIDLIFEFSDWVLRKHPEDGLKIFTEDGLPEVEGLPRAKVLDMLLQKHKDLVIPYLEQIIHGPWNESNGFFHNILIKQYKDKVIQFKTDEKSESRAQLDKYSKKLIKFLRTSNQYHPEKVLMDFPTHDLFEERAIILTKLKKFEKALTIYVQILGDIELAVKYCGEVYRADVLATHSVYTNLIKILLNPPKQSPYSETPLHIRCLQPDVETVLDILERHTDKVDAEEILKMLPNDIPLMRLKKFIETAMHLCLEKKRRIQIHKGLYYAGHLQLQEQRIKLESQHFTLTELSTCSNCCKKFSNQSALVRLPNGNLVHYSCQ